MGYYKQIFESYITTYIYIYIFKPGQQQRKDKTKKSTDSKRSGG